MKKRLVLIFTLISVLRIFAYDTVSLNSVKDIRAFSNENVSAVTYKINNIDLNQLEVKKKKEKFVKLMLPSILIVKQELSDTKEKVKLLQKKEKLTKEEEEFINDLFSRYKVESDINELLVRLNTVPADLALAQAIIESGWGTSRFFKEGNNCYGAWTYRTDLPRIESKKGVRNGKKVYLRKFDSVKESVENYFYNLAVSHAYTDLRSAIQKTSDYKELSKTLGGYSEKGNEYGEYLNSIISYNKLTKYNDYQLTID